MNYKINGQALPIEPSVPGTWSRRSLGLDGNNRVIYEPTYSLVLSWDLLTYAEFKTLYDYWNAISATGTVSVTLPPRSAASFTPFVTYTGCVIDEPTSGDFFNGYYTNVKLMIRNIVI